MPITTTDVAEKGGRGSQHDRNFHVEKGSLPYRLVFIRPKSKHIHDNPTAFLKTRKWEDKPGIPFWKQYLKNQTANKNVCPLSPTPISYGLGLKITTDFKQICDIIFLLCNTANYFAAKYSYIYSADRNMTTNMALTIVIKTYNLAAL